MFDSSEFYNADVDPLEERRSVLRARIRRANDACVHAHRANLRHSFMRALRALTSAQDALGKTYALVEDAPPLSDNEIPF